MNTSPENIDAPDNEISERLLGEAKAALPVEITERYDDLLRWVEGVLDSHRTAAQPVTDFAFERLPVYCPKDVLRVSKAIVCRECPAVPLTQFGLRDDHLPSPADALGFTLRDVYFVTQDAVDDESIHFHELVHVVQWQILGDECFFHLYASGLLSAGYRSSPLEDIAYELQSRFDSNDDEFNVVTEVRQRLTNLHLE